jgi:two-component system sensor histidine kinase CiaH
LIRKLRAKFILTNMLLISIVLVAAFVFMYYSTSQNLETESISAMKNISASGRITQSRSFPGGSKGKDNQYSYFDTFIIDVDYMKSTVSYNGVDITSGSFTEDERNSVITVVKYVLNNTEENPGVLEEYNLRYYTTDIYTSDRIFGNITTGKRVVFLYKNYEDNTLQQLIVTFALVGSGALAAFLVISIIISKIAVAPVEKSMQQQQQLVADASHELKTPITVISANTDILLANKESTIAEQEKWIQYIKTESSRMTDLINNMLFLAKTDETKKAEAQSIINLSDTVNGCILPFESICYEKNKNLESVIMPNVYIKGNENSIKQLIVILVDNAFKYSDENGRIKVSVTDEQDKAVLTVWNTGAPIPADQLSHIFERFYRVDKSRSRKEGGYGLGLSIASSIIESHNAKITVHSTAENGTTFKCVFKKQKMS